MADNRPSRSRPLSLMLPVLLAAGLALPARAQQPAQRPDAGVVSLPPVPAAVEAPSGRAPAAPASAPAPAPAPADVAPPAAIPPPAAVVPASPAPPAGPPTQLEGDRADAIMRDVIQHPPQKQVAQQDASRLRTARLRLGSLLDRSVHGSENSEVGRVIDVMVGEDGKPAALELDVGGFMGVGNRKIAVAWSLFDIARPVGTDPLRVALTEEQVKSAPAAEESGTVTVVTGIVDLPRPTPAPPPAPASAPQAPTTLAVTPTPASGPAPVPDVRPAVPVPVPSPRAIAPASSGNATAPRTNGRP